MADTYEVFAIKYAERNTRTRADSFLDDENPDAQHDMDYYVWVIRNTERTILVDTGYDAVEAKRRGRPIEINPAEALADIGIAPQTIDQCIVTHLHYDHAGCLDHFENATLHIQEREVAFATGRCMCDATVQAPFSADHVCSLIKRLYSGKVTFYEGDAEVAPGISIHRIGGHSLGLQVVRVMTGHGPLVLASDASHYYENFMSGKLFPLVVDKPAMLQGFNRLKELAENGPERIIPGHDPLVRAHFPTIFEGSKAQTIRLDLGPRGKFM